MRHGCNKLVKEKKLLQEIKQVEKEKRNLSINVDEIMEEDDEYSRSYSVGYIVKDIKVRFTFYFLCSHL